MKLKARQDLIDERALAVINDEWQPIDKIQARCIDWQHPVVKIVSYSALVRSLKRLANEHKIVLFYDEAIYKYVARKMF